MSGSCNLALLSPQDLKALKADRIACRYRTKQKAMGKDWRPWVVEQLASLPPEMSEAVKERLNARAR